jgi:hypothetical protein
MSSSTEQNGSAAAKRDTPADASAISGLSPLYSGSKKARTEKGTYVWIDCESSFVSS